MKPRILIIFALLSLVLPLTTTPAAAFSSGPSPSKSIPGAAAGDVGTLPPTTGTIVVNQGDLFTTDIATGPQGITLGARCTVGYIDHSQHRAWTAAHCGDDGTGVKDSRGRYIGTFRWANGNRYTTGDNLEGASRDVAFIEFTPEVIAGDNTYSGDSVVDMPAHVGTGQPACAYGHTTGAVTCGTTRMYPKPAIKYDAVARIDDLDIRQGDSGGPVWLPGEGFIGVICSKHHHADGSSHTLTAVPPHVIATS